MVSLSLRRSEGNRKGKGGVRTRKDTQKTKERDRKCKVKRKVKGRLPQGEGKERQRTK